MSSHLAKSNIQHAVPASSVQSSIATSTITKRNAKLKKGFGAKRLGGLAGKKVSKADFETLEKIAKEHDQVKSSLPSTTSSHISGTEKNLVSEESVRLAYQDISLKEKQVDARLNNMDENKKEQANRLGMGMGKNNAISHTVDLITIDQVNPVTQPRKKRISHNDDSYSSCVSNTKRDRLHIPRWDAKDENEDNLSMSKIDFSYSEETRSSLLHPAQNFTVMPIVQDHSDEANAFQPAEQSNSKTHRRSLDSSIEATSGKYKNAKAISSDMLFEPGSGERLRKFKGRTSISSDDFVDQETSRPPNVKKGSEIRGGMKESVRSVAGKISSMASGIAVNLKGRYG